VRALGPPQVGRGGDKLHAQLEAWVARAKALLCQSIGFGSATRRGAWLLRATLAAARRDTRVVRLHDRDDTKVGVPVDTSSKFLGFYPFWYKITKRCGFVVIKTVVTSLQHMVSQTPIVVVPKSFLFEHDIPAPLLTMIPCVPGGGPTGILDRAV